MSAPDPATYPCPACHATADLAAGCPGCGRQPDPEAAEVIRLGAEAHELREAIDEVRQEYSDLLEELATTERQRNEFAARIRARTDTELAAAGASPAPGAASPTAFLARIPLPGAAARRSQWWPCTRSYWCGPDAAMASARGRRPGAGRARDDLRAAPPRVVRLRDAIGRMH
jgi:hypothetical protein